MADFNVVFDRSILSDITSLGPRSCSAYDLGGLLEWDFLQAGCSSCRQISSVRALRGKHKNVNILPWFTNKETNKSDTQ